MFKYKKLANTSDSAKNLDIQELDIWTVFTFLFFNLQSYILQVTVCSFFGIYANVCYTVIDEITEYKVFFWMFPQEPTSLMAGSVFKD